jgi:hypothetical protein
LVILEKYKTWKMKRTLLLAIACLFYSLSFSQSLQYYLPQQISYNKAIPVPADIIHHQVGEWHITHDRLVDYMEAIAAAAPKRVKLQTLGYTYERRPQVLLIFSSEKNLQRLASLQEQHLLLSDPARSGSLQTDNMPAVVYIGHSIHGNEPSGSNASLLSAYYLAAAEGPAIENLLENTIILFDPAFNPDGLQRFSTWANQHKSKNLVTDPNSREFNEVWPGGRYNHYWFDLNRDWLPGVHPESVNRIRIFHEWKPNVLTDHHEQGSNASFFFQPGVPSRVNPLTPARNQELTNKLGRYHAKSLDSIGSLYFTKENYDDFYYGKGSTFPDINGGVGILFEQASSRGHAQETQNGILTFPATIRNQFVTTLSTLYGALDLRKELLEFQRDFYKQSLSAENKSYVFGDKYDKTKTNLFIEMMLRHRIAIHEYAGPYDETYQQGNSFVVNLQQPQQVLIKAIFDKQLKFTDSLFYDISSWTMPHAFGIAYKEIAGASAGKKITELPVNERTIIGSKSDYAYMFSWDEFYAPKALYELQNAGILCKVATRPTSVYTPGPPQKFGYGSILVPVTNQNISPDRLLSIMQDITKKYALNTHAIRNGLAVEGVDMGSSKFVPVTKPRIAMLAGTGVNELDAGEVWHLLDQRMNIPSTHLGIDQFNNMDLSRYNTIIMVSGNYASINRDKLKAWVQAGGNLILLEEAVSWAAENGVNSVKLKKAKSPTDSTIRLPYIQREQIDGNQQMNGAIYSAEVDLTHPLAYGYHTKTISLFKPNKVFMEMPKSPYASPFYYGANPLVSGYASRENAAAIKNSAAVIVNAVGTGRIINISENVNLRGFWLSGTKMLMNAIFFGRHIDAGTARTEE